MTKKLEIRIGESVFEATLLEKLAPVTCVTVSKHLPYEGEAVHAGWSGESIFVPCTTIGNIPQENSTIYGSAGDVVWNATTNNEFFIAYGIAQYRYRFGPLVCNLFAKITDNLEELNKVFKEMQRKGARKLSVREA